MNGNDVVCERIISEKIYCYKSADSINCSAQSAVYKSVLTVGLEKRLGKIFTGISRSA